MKRVLLLAGSAGSGRYTRCAVLQKMKGVTLDTVWLDKLLHINFKDGSSLLQNGRHFKLRDYSLIIYWPPSFQYAGVRIGSAYFRKGFDEYLLRCWKVAEDALFLGVEEKMLNAFTSACSAANKINLFLNVAKMNIPVPKTVITNDFNDLQSLPGETFVLKTVTDTIDINKKFKIFTTKAPPRISERELSPSPVIFQEYIEPTYEYRSYFFHGTSLIGRIDRDADGLIDIRLKPGRSLPCNLIKSEPIARYMGEISHFYSLRMFSADFIEDAAGNLYLLDVNPHGSWHWLNKNVRDPLDMAFSSMIAGLLEAADQP